MRERMKNALTAFVVMLVALMSIGPLDVKAEIPVVMKKQEVRLPNGVRLEYVERGDKKGTCIIFLHGYTDSWRSFEKVISEFPEGYHVIAISQRGHGDSDKPETGYHPSDFAADLAQFIKKKKLGPCVIAGHSLGGLIAQQFALDYPDLTKGVVIESSAPSFADNAGVPEFLGEVMKLSDPVSRNFAADFQRSTIAQPVADDEVNTYIDETAKVPASVWRAIAGELLKVDYREHLQKIKVPVLVLWGNKDSFCLQDDQDQFTKGLPASTLMVYEGTGHAIHWENPDKYIEDVSAFAGQCK